MLVLSTAAVTRVVAGGDMHELEVGLCVLAPWTVKIQLIPRSVAASPPFLSVRVKSGLGPNLLQRRSPVLSALR